MRAATPALSSTRRFDTSTRRSSPLRTARCSDSVAQNGQEFDMEHPLEGVNDPVNAWRLETPGTSGWARSVWPGAPNRYFMFSSDSHIVEPPTLWMERIDARYRDRLPRIH